MVIRMLIFCNRTPQTLGEADQLWPVSEMDTCCFWSFSSQKKTIDGDWAGSERFDVALWGHVNQGNHI